MNQNSDPKHLEWFQAPLPSPDTVHPNARIVVWQNHYDLENLTLLIVASKSYIVGEKTIHHYVSSSGKTFVDPKQKVSWAWWKSWNKISGDNENLS